MLCAVAEVRALCAQVVYEEPFLTGNGSQTTFFLKIEQERLSKKGLTVVPDTEKIYLTDGDDETEPVRDTDYTIDYERGKVTFTTAPGEGVEGSATFNHSGLKRISDETISNLIQQSQTLIEAKTGYKYESTTVQDEVYNPPVLPYNVSGASFITGSNVLMLNNAPVTAVTKLEIDGTEIDLNKIFLDPPQLPMSLILTEGSFGTKTHSIKVSYQYGFSLEDSRPATKGPAETAKSLCLILTILAAAGVNIYNLSWTSPGNLGFGAMNLGTGTYLTAGEAQLQRWTKQVESLFQALPVRIGVA